MTTPLDQARAISEEALDQIMRAAMQSDYGYAFVGDRDYPNGRDDLRAAVDKAWQAAIASRAVPEGWKLVPIKPTDEMMGAVVSSMDEHLMGKDGAEAQYREDWAAMLRAAPTPQAPPIAAKAAKETTA